MYEADVSRFLKQVMMNILKFYFFYYQDPLVVRRKPASCQKATKVLKMKITSVDAIGGISRKIYSKQKIYIKYEKFISLFVVQNCLCSCCTREKEAAVKKKNIV